MLSVDFLLLCEGSSDANLVEVIRALLLQEGFERVSGDFHSGGGSVANKVRSALEHGPSFDVLFVHRDADSRDAEPRHREISEQVRSGGWQGDYVCVVPVQATEAWLLADEQEIRAAVGRPSGKVTLGLPKIAGVENQADPKGLLNACLLTAAQAHGRRLQSEKKRFNARRHTLLSRLNVDGPVKQLPSFQRLASDIGAFSAERRKRMRA